MPSPKFAVIFQVMVLFGIMAHAVVATAPLSQSHFTETAAPQELGSTTVEGSLVYSMNYCTIVHNTDCVISLSTGGAAPSPPQSTAPQDGASTQTDNYPEPTGEPTGTEPASSGEYYPPTSPVEPSVPGESGGVTDTEYPPEEPTGSVIISTDVTGGTTTTVSEDASATHSASTSGVESVSEPYNSGTKTEDKPTSTETEGGPSGTASGTPSPGAATSNLPGFAFGIAGIVVAMLF